jgi:phosphopantothenate-cysteine ligase
MKILVTSGGTKIPIDRVRDITNMSKGTFGSKIATEFLKLGHKVVFMKAKGSITPMTLHLDLYHHYQKLTDVNILMKEMNDFTSFFADNIENYQEYEYVTYEQYAGMLKFVIGVEQPDVILLAAAVSDYGVENYFEGKLRSNDVLKVQLKQLPKLITLVKDWAPNAKLVGFKLLVNSRPNDLIEAAKRSINDNKCDLVVANDLQDIKDNNHKLYLVHKNGELYVTEQFLTDHNDPNYLAKVVAEKTLTL